MGGRLPALRQMWTHQPELQAQEAHVGAAHTIEVINEALFLTVDSPLESWITTPGAPPSTARRTRGSWRSTPPATTARRTWQTMRPWTLLEEVTCVSSYRVGLGGCCTMWL
ncbi:hypothetical protein C1H46_021017 [Malus baccata]|uniref:Uncharacterized protein n=1 Tax=Malus baccata TaxID=106549 RepID=A0A540M3R7_MALBA|nr:hypothetical protein C1H46_021017 [Malus baccata]